MQTADWRRFCKKYSSGDYRYKLATLCFHQKCTKPLIDQKDCSYQKMGAKSCMKLNSNYYYWLCLTAPNTPLIHTSYLKWNMGEICGLKFSLLYVNASQFSFKFLHAQKRSFLLLNLQFWQKSTFLRSKKDFLKKALRMEGFQKYFFCTTFPHHF